MNLDVIVWMVFANIGLSFCVLPFLPVKIKSVAALAFVGINSLFTSYLAVYVLTNESIEIVFYGGRVFGDIPIRLDTISAWFLLVINLTSFTGAWYGIGYMKAYTGQHANTTLHWIMFVSLHAVMLMVCTVQNSLAFLIVWELMSISSLLLVVYEHHKAETIKAGINYLVQMHIGVVFLSTAFIWVYISEGSFDFESIRNFFNHSSPIVPFFLFFIGFGIKAGFIPMHTWLPQAHPAAPSHISGVMSGVIVKMGIYGILRMGFYLETDLLLIGEFILILSVITAFYGILNGAVVRDFKRMLAFCTIENIGIIGMGIGIGLIGKGIANPYMMLIGFTAALLHILNHALYKLLLFCAAGNIYQQTHTRNMELLGGLSKRMPVTAFMFLVGALAIGGLPPFNGFISEFLIYSGLLDGIKSGDAQFSSMMILCVGGLAAVGGISLLTFTKTFGTIFLGSPRTDLQHQPREVPLAMQIPLFLILGFVLLIGIFPNTIFTSALMVASAMGGVRPPENLMDISPVLITVGRGSMLLILLTMLIYFIRSRISTTKPIAYQPSWGCGYIVPNSRMQYTAKSFSKSLAKLFSIIVSEKKKYQEIPPYKIFPLTRSFHSSYQEFFENSVIGRTSNLLINGLNYFGFINNGRIQMYILYGFFFIVILIAATFFNLL